MDNLTGFSLGTQYNFAVKSDSKLTTQSVAQNPGVVDVEVCTVTSCSYNPSTDVLFVYPPGTPRSTASRRRAGRLRAATRSS